MRINQVFELSRRPLLYPGKQKYSRNSKCKWKKSPVLPLKHYKKVFPERCQWTFEDFQMRFAKNPCYETNKLLL